MPATAISHRRPAPSAQEAALARSSGQTLSRYKGRTQSLSIRVMEAGQEQPLELPAGAVALLMNILEAMAAGQGVSIIPENAELTTVQAADILNVSRAYLLKILKKGAIPYRTVGKHRRLLMEDVMSYKRQTKAKREAILDQLASDAQETEMGYSLP